MRTAPSLYRSLSEEVRRERSPRRDARIGRTGKGVNIPIHPVLPAQIVQAGSVPLRTVLIAIKDQGTSSGKHGSRNRNLKAKKGKEPVKVKLEDGDQKAFMKNIADALEAIKVNLTDNWKPRRIVSTSRANV